MAQTVTEYLGASVLDNFDILNLADVYLWNSRRNYETSDLKWPDSEANDSALIGKMLNENECRVWLQDDPEGYRLALTQALSVASEYLREWAYQNHIYRTQLGEQ